jgi:hypothetical protein
MEDVVGAAPPNIPRRRPWRTLSNPKVYDFGKLSFQDRWTLSKQQANSTQLFREDFAELANIAQSYQSSLPRRVCCPSHNVL